MLCHITSQGYDPILHGGCGELKLCKDLKTQECVPCSKVGRWCVHGAVYHVNVLDNFKI